MTDYGLPQPDHDVLEAHPTVSDDLLSRLGHGDIKVKPTISRFEGSTVVFADGSRVDADVVVYCTGYKVTFPFLDESVWPPTTTTSTSTVVSPRRTGPACGSSACAAARGGDAAGRGAGALGRRPDRRRVTLPSRAEMRAQIAAYDAALRKRFVASKRHTIEVDFHAYLREIRRERKRAAQRA